MNDDPAMRVDGDGSFTEFRNPDRTYKEAEEAECAHLFLDDRGVSRTEDDKTLSLVGRIMAYKNVENRSESDESLDSTCWN